MPNPEGQPQRRVNEIPPDQDQCDREEVRSDNLDTRLVRLGGRQALPSARAGLLYKLRRGCALSLT
jgi:hypothetical protein